MYTLNLWENLPEQQKKSTMFGCLLLRQGLNIRAMSEVMIFGNLQMTALNFYVIVEISGGYVLQSDKEDFIYDGEFEEADYLDNELHGVYQSFFENWVRDLLNKLNYEDWYKFVTEAFGFDFDPHPAYWPKLPKEIIEKSDISNK